MSKDNATQEGVLDDTTVNEHETDVEPIVEPVQNPRDLYMKQLAERRMEELSEANAEHEAEMGITPQDNTDAIGDEDTTEEVVVKVDGEEETLTQKELDDKIREYQKHKAADKRLEEAAEERKRLEQEQATLKEELEKIKNLKQEVTPVQDATPATLSEDDEELAEEFIKEIREGDDEDAIKATKKFVRSLKKSDSTFNPSEIDDIVSKKFEESLKAKEEQVIKEQNAAFELEREAAETSFKEHYHDELNDSKYFYDLAIMEDAKLREDSEWQNKPLKDRFIEAGKRASSWIDGSNTVIDEAKQKEKEKEKIVPIRSASSRANIGNDDPEVMSRSDVISEMRKKRGQG